MTHTSIHTGLLSAKQRNLTFRMRKYAVFAWRISALGAARATLSVRNRRAHNSYIGRPLRRVACRPPGGASRFDDHDVDVRQAALRGVPAVAAGIRGGPSRDQGR